MPNGLTDQQTEALDFAAERFIVEHPDVNATDLPSIVMREASGETVFLYEKVEAYISKLRPTTKEERNRNESQYRLLTEAWSAARKDALKQAKNAGESNRRLFGFPKRKPK